MLFWKLSFYEMVTRTQLKMGEELSKLITQHNSLVDVVSAALGGKSDMPEANLNQAPTFEAALANINVAMNFG